MFQKYQSYLASFAKWLSARLRTKWFWVQNWLQSPTCIDNFLTNKKAYFIKTLTFETGVSDHHKLIGTMLRSTKGEPKKMFYRSYRNFGNKRFEEELQKQLP